MTRMLRFGVRFGIVGIIAMVSVCGVAEGVSAQPHLLTVLGSPPHPAGIAVNPTNNHIYVASSDDFDVSIINESNGHPSI